MKNEYVNNVLEVQFSSLGDRSTEYMDEVVEIIINSFNTNNSYVVMSEKELKWLDQKLNKGSLCI